MTTWKMFNALGYYEKDVGYTNILCYEKDISIQDVPHYIGLQFVLNHEYISIYSHVGGKYEYGKERNYSYGAFNGFDVELLRAIEQQMKELGWLEEKVEIKEATNPEVTNLEYYKDEILENCIENLAVVKGRPKLCYKTNCNDCDFKLVQKGCHNKVKDWLKQAHEKPVYKLTKFEIDLLQSCSQGYSPKYQFKNINSLTEMREKGYFKGIDRDATIEDILAKCEVVG